MRAGERLVLGRLEHVRAQVVLVLDLPAALPVDAGQPLDMRPRKRVVVVLPAPARSVERDLSYRVPSEASAVPTALGLRGAEAECKHRLAVAAEDDARGLDDVAVDGVLVHRSERVRAVELGQPVARSAGEAAGGLARTGRRARRIPAVRSRGWRRSSPSPDRTATSTGWPVEPVDRRRVGAAVAGAAAAVSVHASDRSARTVCSPSGAA